MKQLKIFKCISIVSYLLIILAGEMIGLPFFLWLLSGLLAFGDIDQLFAFLAIAGLKNKFYYQKQKKNIQYSVAGYNLLLASPVVRQMTVVPINLFNYWSFIIPAIIFALFYLISICYSVALYLKSE